MKVHEILEELMIAFDLEKGGELAIADKCLNAAIRIHDKMNKKNMDIVRSCPNCNSDNTREESLNDYICRHCEGEPDTEF